MFPYRRSNQRKRSSKPNPRRNRTGARRLPGSARELLPLLQPTTKALAQALAGNSKLSGQLVHARAVVERGEAFLADKQVERLNPRDREEFLEQFARLKLTVADAIEEFGMPPEVSETPEGQSNEQPEEEVEETEEEVAERRAAEKVAKAEDQERLRRVALALMTNSRPEPTGEAPNLVFDSEPTSAPKPMKSVVRPEVEAASANGEAAKSRRPRLRLKGADQAVDEDAAGEAAGAADAPSPNAAATEAQ